MTELDWWHGRSSKNRAFLYLIEGCGCFYCLRKFRCYDIKEWIQDDLTALCPHCGIDSVLPIRYTNFPDILLKQMRDHWFRPV